MLNGNGKQCKSINRSSKKSFWLRPEMNINSIIGTNNFVINQIPLNLWTSWAGSTSHILLSNLRDRNKEQQLLLFDPKKRRKKQWRVRMSFVIYHLPWPGDCESFFVLVCGCGSTERAQWTIYTMPIRWLQQNICNLLNDKTEIVIVLVDMIYIYMCMYIFFVCVYGEARRNGVFNSKQMRTKWLTIDIR